MHDVANAGRTIIFVSHNMRAITSLCNRTIRMHGGYIVDDGTPAEVVDRYLSSGDIKENIAEWDAATAPQNEFLYLEKVSVQSDRQLKSDILMSDDFSVTIQYHNKVSGSNLAISLHLFNEQGDLIMNPSNGSDSLTLNGLGKEGYITKFHFPKNTLNSGRYLLTLLFVEKGGVQRLWVKDVVTFQVHDRSIKDVDAWFGRNPGLVVLPISTNTDYL